LKEMNIWAMPSIFLGEFYCPNIEPHPVNSTVFTFTTIRNTYELDVNYRKKPHRRRDHGAVAVALDLF
jgi:hypothetical protein